MKIRVSFWLTITLFVMMLAGGIASGFLGYIMGREALKAVTQPDINSSESIANKDPVGGNHKGLKIVNERDVLVKVYNFVSGKEQKQSSNERSPKDTAANLVAYEKKPQIDPAVFPIGDSQQGVTLNIEDGEFKDGSLWLNVNLKNEGDRDVRFLYSFLDVRDDRNRPLSAISDRLPGELPPNGEDYRGVLRIPQVLLDNTKYISLTITNYPEQTLELKLPRIPISH